MPLQDSLGDKLVGGAGWIQVWLKWSSMGGYLSTPETLMSFAPKLVIREVVKVRKQAGGKTPYSQLILRQCFKARWTLVQRLIYVRSGFCISLHCGPCQTM